MILRGEANLILGHFDKAMADLIAVHERATDSSLRARVESRLNIAGYTARYAAEAVEMIDSGDFVTAYDRLTHVLEVSASIDNHILDTLII